VEHKADMNPPHDDKNTFDDELATVVVSFISRLRDLGCQPNRTVVFGDAAPLKEEPGVCRGWLLDDTLFRDRSARWLLLDDGHVWHETLYETEEESFPECTWVEWRSERLTELLTLTLTDVQRGGRGGLAQGDGHDQFRVHDRRHRHDPQVESDRRRREPSREEASRFTRSAL
jgi:hypothetical protein